MNPLSAKVTLDRTAARLSESVILTISISGPAPLVVSPETQILKDESALAWNVTSLDPARLEPIANGEERWIQKYSLSPFELGKAIPIQLKPLQVSAAGKTIQLELPTQSVEIHSQLSGPKFEDLRGITGIEELPAADPTFSMTGSMSFLALAALVLLVVFQIWRRIRRPAPSISSAEWANQELDQLLGDWQAKQIALPVFSDRLSSVVRTFLEHHYRFPATQRTTSEVLSRVANQVKSDSLRSLLEWCDLVKFAGESMPEEECLLHLQSARILVQESQNGEDNPRASTAGVG